MIIHNIEYYPEDVQALILEMGSEPYSSSDRRPHKANPYGQYFTLKSGSFGINFLARLTGMGYEIFNPKFIKYSYPTLYYNDEPNHWPKVEKTEKYTTIYFTIRKNNISWSVGVERPVSSQLDRFVNYLEKGYDEGVIDDFIKSAKDTLKTIERKKIEQERLAVAMR